MPLQLNPAKSSIELSDEQETAIEQMLNSGSPVQTLGGYAGAGKTTVIKHLIRRLSGYAVCAFTGKAANVLRRKGVEASTIHSLIYEPHEYRDKQGKKRVEWLLKGDLDCGGIIVDESSMVGENLYRDLCSFNVPMIFVGDHGQLEPVGDSGFNLMAQPDIRLETIHRNAGKIAQFANFIRKGNAPSMWRRHKDYRGERVRFLPMAEACEVEDYDQVICGTNAMRVAINKAFREESRGQTGDTPIVGDRVMCLQNDRRIGVFNGQQGIVEALHGHDEMIFAVDGREYEVRYASEAFNRVKRPEERERGRIPFDFAYCITCHKAQGDEWDRVLVLEQRSRLWDFSRWAYTAASRARLRVDWVE